MVVFHSYVSLLGSMSGEPLTQAARAWVLVTVLRGILWLNDISIDGGERLYIIHHIYIWICHIIRIIINNNNNHNNIYIYHIISLNNNHYMYVYTVYIYIYRWFSLVMILIASCYAYFLFLIMNIHWSRSQKCNFKAGKCCVDSGRKPPSNLHCL